jgi:uncharacterized protein YkwD
MRWLSPFVYLIATGVICSTGAIGLRGANLSAASPAPATSAAPAVYQEDSYVLPTPVTKQSPSPVPTELVERPAVEATSVPVTPTVALAPAPVSGVSGMPTPAAADPAVAAPDLAEALLSRMNDARTNEGLPPLAPLTDLDAVALVRARSLVAEGYFDHYAPDGSSAFSVLGDHGIAYRLAGENLARNNYPEARTASAAFEALMGSPGHRANILEPRFGSVGVACLRDGRMWVYVTVFTD